MSAYYKEHGGWETAAMPELMDWLKKVERLRYELENCERGAYALRGGCTVADLLAHLDEMNQELTTVTGELESRDDT